MNFQISNRATDTGCPSIRVNINRNPDGTLTFEVSEQGEDLEGPHHLSFDVAEETLVGSPVDDDMFSGWGLPDSGDDLPPAGPGTSLAPGLAATGGPGEFALTAGLGLAVNGGLDTGGNSSTGRRAPGRNAVGPEAPEAMIRGCISVFYETVDADGKLGMETLTLAMAGGCVDSGTSASEPVGESPRPVPKVPSSVAISVDDGEMTTSIIQITPPQDRAAGRSLQELDTAALLARHQGGSPAEGERSRGTRLGGRVHLVGVSMRNDWWRRQAQLQRVGRLSAASASVLSGRPVGWS